ncbi:MAG TPA: phage terminase large subunit [Clostridia bacterium]|nr:phage terminase large subunit [Clostridia bacterium]
MAINLNEYIGVLSNDQQLLDEAKYQRELFEQYVARSDTWPELRRELQRDYRAGVPITGKHGLRRRLGAIDLEYFGRAYLPHYFVRPSPAFHGELDAIWMQGVLKGQNALTSAETINKKEGCKRAIAAPRGHAKSTSFTFKDNLHATLYGYKHYLLILSDSSEQAQGFLADIKTELEENTRIAEDFGNLCGDKVWTASVIVTSTDVKIEAIGSGKKIRGRRHRNWRPDLITLDDIENDENVQTPEQRKKLDNWFKKAVSKAGDTYTDIVYIGTILHFDSLLSKVLHNPDYESVIYRAIISESKNPKLWDAWTLIFTALENPRHKEDAAAFFEENREAMLEGTQVLWPEKMSYYKLMVMKVSEGEASFNSELQNNPVDPDSCLIQEEWLDYYDDDPPDFASPEFVLFAANDPSLGKDKNADTSSLIGVAKNIRTGYIYVVEGSTERRTPDVIIDDAIEMQRRAKRDFHKAYYRYGVETVQFQYFFSQILAKRALASGEHLAIEEINNRQSKDIRIGSLAPLIKNRYIKFSHRHKALITQMLEYPHGKNDDGPDGLEMAVRLAINCNVGMTTEYYSVQHRGARFRSGAY